MRVIPFLAALMLASGASVRAWAADLTRIDRAIAKEPDGLPTRGGRFFSQPRGIGG